MGIVARLCVALVGAVASLAASSGAAWAQEIAQNAERNVILGQPTCELPVVASSIDLGKDISASTNVYLSAWMARIVQMDAEVFKQEIMKAPFPVRSVKLMGYSRFGVQGAVVESDDFNVVLFRGTQDVIDSILDANFIIVNGARYGLPGGVTHGFALGFASLWPQTIDALLEIKAWEKPVWLVGHSLGGVYAQYTAYKLTKQNFDVRAVYGFAAPVAGNGEFAETYDATLREKTFVSQYGMDITPHMPPLASAGSDFLNLLPRKIRGWAKRVVDGGNYTAVGRFFVQGSLGSPLIEVADRSANERNYWSTLGAEGVPIPFIFLTDKRLVVDHGVDFYLCSLTSLVQPQ